MRYGVMVKLLTDTSLQEPLSPLTVRLLMNRAQAAEIAQRLRELRDNSRETNRTIGDYCDVAERTVAGWASPTSPQGLTFAHAEKVAELFEVDLDWFWRGRMKPATPDLNGVIAERLAGIEERLEELAQLLGPIAAAQALADGTPAKPEPQSQSDRAQASSDSKSQAAKRRAGSQ